VVCFYKLFNPKEMTYFTHLQAIFRYLGLYIFCFFTQTAYTQKTDKIYQTDSSTLFVTVVFTVGDTVWYRPYFANKSTNLFGLLKTDVDKIVYKNGVIEYYGGKSIKYPPIESERTTDVIYTKNGDVLPAQVLSMGGDSIQYRPYFSKIFNIKIFSLSKTDVDIICYKSGENAYFSGRGVEETRKKDHSMDSLRRFLYRKKNIIKISPLTNIVGYSTFGYERMIVKGQSVEAKLGVIGLGSVWEKDIPQEGYYGSISYKVVFHNVGDFYHPRHSLDGFYVRPEFVGGSYTHTFKNEIFRGGNNTPEIREKKHHISYQCAMLNIGRQWISHPFVVDLFAGTGLGAFTQSEESANLIDRARYAYRMDLKGKTGSTPVKFKLGLYMGLIF
jgi:hypothetical protein